MAQPFELSVNELLSGGNVRAEVDTELAASLKKHGMLEPIQVYQLEDGAWRVHDGHRRLAGAIAAGLERVPCKRVPAPEDEPDRITKQYVINEHRKGLSKLDKANLFRELIDNYDYTQAMVAREYGVSESEVSLALAAQRAHPEIGKAMLDGKISASAARPILALPVEEQGKIAAAAIQAKTVTAIDQLVKAHRKANGLERPRKNEKKIVTVDPADAMALDAIETANASLHLLETGLIRDPNLRERALAALVDIIEKAEAVRLLLETTPTEGTLEEALDWDELAQNL